MYKSLVLSFILAFTSINALSAQAPWSQHGPLQTSTNGHYIQHEDSTPFLWIGDTGWGLIQQLTREEIDQYLDNRKVLGFNVIQTVIHWSPHGGGLERSPDNAANAYGHRPFSGPEAAPNTAEPLIVEGGSPEAQNDYWDHVDYVIAAAKERDLYLGLLPCWGSELITNNGEYTAAEAKAYGTFLGQRYGKEPHLIWILGGDTKAQFRGYDKHQRYYDYDHRRIYRSMAEGIVLGVSDHSPEWDEPHSAWDEVFMTYHPNGDYPYGSAQWFHEDAWLDANGVEVWKEVDDVYRSMLDDYQRREPIKPSLFLEGSYEYGTYRHECGWVTPVMVRRQLYQTFFAGGAGHTYGAAPIWAMRGQEGDYNCGYSWQQALDFPGAAQVADIARKFLLEHRWHEWQPNGNLLLGAGQGTHLKAAVTSTYGSKALIYFSNNSATQINNILGAEADAEWFYPRNGQVEKTEWFKQDESRVMTPPTKWEDAILILTARQ